MNRNIAAATAISLALLAGCQSATTGDIVHNRIIGGSTTEVRAVRPVQGFLPSPALLTPGGDGDPALLYRNPDVGMARYRALILEPVAVWASPGSAFAGVPAADRQSFANAFTSDLAKALRAHCTVTTRPAPGVARLRFALVDAEPANATLNTAATYIPFVSAAYTLGSTVLNKDVGYFAGSATAEGYATDAVNGTLLWEGVTRRAGKAAAFENTLDSSLDINHAFEEWSSQLVSRLQKAGVCRT